MSIFVKQLGRHVTGRETGSNKASASKSCALSIIRQLYHLGVIEAFSGTLKKEKSGQDMSPYKVQISPQLEAEIDDCLKDLNVNYTKVPQENSDQGMSLLSSQILEEFAASNMSVAGVVPWSPPQPNWNPWTNCNIDEGPLSTASLDDLSKELLQQSRDYLQNNRDLQVIIKDRCQLPVYNMKNTIMEAIHENSVVIIRGNTGCGKYL